MADENPQYTNTTSTTTSSSTCTPIVINTNNLLSVMESASSEVVPHEIDVSKLVEAATKSELQQPSSIENTTPTGTASTDVISIVSTAAHSSFQQEGGGTVIPPSSSSPRPIKHRPTFTEEQIQTMEAIFKHRQYLTPIERESVATAVGLTAQQVRVWFQNRRQKAKQFLAYKQHQQNTNTSMNDEDGETATTPNEGTNNAGTGQADINSLLAKLQKPAIDPQLIQLIMPKSSTASTDQSTATTTSNTEQVKLEQEQSNTGGDSAPQLGVVSSNGTISINSQSLLCLTPLLVSSINKSLEENSNTTGTAAGTNATIPINAIQLLQSLSAATSKLSQTPPPIGKKDVSTPTPLRAQSPVPVEQTITKSCDTTPIVPISNSTNTESPTTTDTEQLQETPSAAAVTSSATEILSNDVLQQILQASMEKAKPQTTPLVTTPTSKLPPSLSLSLSSTAAERPSRKKRQVFSGHQIAEMEKHFEQSPYIDNKEREILAAQIGLMPDQVKVWFQNRRTKKTRLSWRQSKDSPEQ